MSPEIDPFSVKAGDGLDEKYSARSLCQNVLVPNATELSVDLSVTGKEPLNNQPYFRIDRVSSEMPIHKNARLVAENLTSLLNLIDQIKDPKRQRKFYERLLVSGGGMGPSSLKNLSHRRKSHNRNSSLN